MTDFDYTGDVKLSTNVTTSAILKGTWVGAREQRGGVPRD